jgi:hypothetical protein
MQTERTPKLFEFEAVGGVPWWPNSMAGRLHRTPAPCC